VQLVSTRTININSFNVFYFSFTSFVLIKITWSWHCSRCCRWAEISRRNVTWKLELTSLQPNQTYIFHNDAISTTLRRIQVTSHETFSILSRVEVEKSGSIASFFSRSPVLFMRTRYVRLHNKVRSTIFTSAHHLRFFRILDIVVKSVTPHIWFVRFLSPARSSAINAIAIWVLQVWPHLRIKVVQHVLIHF
jgi:hypothetical protein